jgi:outer membrane protein assembly factor BamB
MVHRYFHFTLTTTIVALWFALGLGKIAQAQHQVILQGNERLVILSPNGFPEWELKWGGIHDIHVLPSGNIMVQDGKAKVVEIDRATKKVIWSYDSATQNGNEDKPVEVHAFQPLENGNVMLAESGIGRIIEIDRTGQLLKEIRLKLNQPHFHMDTRLARKLASGNYLVCHEGDGFVREYGQDGSVVWEFEVPLFGQERKDGHGPEAFGNKVFSAVRLPSGNTLVGTGNGHSVLEVSPDKQIVWQLKQHDLPNITLAWVTTLEVLPNGNYVIGNCHAGPGNPVLIEIEPRTKQVIWTLDAHEVFGNSVSNSQVLDLHSSSFR